MKMFKNIKMNKAKIIGVFAVMLVIASCTKKFEELNTNRNAPTENNPATFVTKRNIRAPSMIT
jgi:hypothetical protein